MFGMRLRLEPFRDLWTQLRAAARIFHARGGRLLSGAVAFYALFSIVPMLIIAIQIAGSLIGTERARLTLSHELVHWVGPNSAGTLLALMDSMSERLAAPAQPLSFAFLRSRLVAGFALVYGSTRLWSQMQHALDWMWGITPAEARSTRSGPVIRQLRKRGLSFAIVVIAGFTLSAMAIGHTMVARMHLVAEALPSPLASAEANQTIPSRAIAAASSFAASVLPFFVVLQALPSKRAPLLATLRGAVVTALLFTLGSVLVGAYVAHKGASSAYGAATSVVMLLLWVHYSAHVFFFGAAFTHVHARASVASAKDQEPARNLNKPGSL
jgi:membrane protein